MNGTLTCTKVQRGYNYDWSQESIIPVGGPLHGAPLGNNADFASLTPVSLPPPATVNNWRLRSYGREILAKHGVAKRMRWCGSKISDRQDGVGVYSRPDRPYGRVQGVCVCGQSLACPVCAPRIASFRAAEVAEAFRRATAAGYEARLVTYTMPHSSQTSLGKEIDTFSVAWRQFQSGKRSQFLRQGSFGNHVGRECTWGIKNGWHFHQHQLRYDEVGKFDQERAHAQWLSALDFVGRKWRGAEVHAFDAGIVGDESGARYVAKLATSVEAQSRAIGSEISSSITKGRNIVTLLASASQGDDQAADVWFKGVCDIISRKVSSVRWSRGLRQKLGLVDEKSDEQVAQEEILKSDIFLGALTPQQWRGILRARCEFALCVSANQGEDSVNELLANLNLGRLNDDAPPAVETPLDGEIVYRPLPVFV